MNLVSILLLSYNRPENLFLYRTNSSAFYLTTAKKFYVVNNRLDLFCFNRSQDCMLGVPFNIASSALLLFLIAKITNLVHLVKD